MQDSVPLGPQLGPTGQTILKQPGNNHAMPLGGKFVHNYSIWRYREKSCLAWLDCHKNICFFFNTVYSFLSIFNNFRTWSQFDEYYVTVAPKGIWHMHHRHAVLLFLKTPYRLFIQMYQKCTMRVDRKYRISRKYLFINIFSPNWYTQSHCLILNDLTQKGYICTKKVPVFKIGWWCWWVVLANMFSQEIVLAYWFFLLSFKKAHLSP